MIDLAVLKAWRLGKVSNQSACAADVGEDHLKYRPDIDGLRAIAVLSVIGYHAFPDWITGGFIGVDIFFAISGFLITTIILKGLTADTFSFYEFYSRRVRRIFPSLLAVCITCYVVGWFSLMDHEFKELGKHMAAGAAFVSNLVLWGESGYFDSSVHTKVLLHLWSLGIEEQFYIAWPFVLWFLHRKGFNLLTASVGIGVASFVVGLSYLASAENTSAFYLPHARVWELLVGAMLAYLTFQRTVTDTKIWARAEAVADALIYADKSRRGRGLTLCNISSFVGLCFLITGFAVTTASSLFPGWLAVLPVVGAALVIAAGPRSWANRSILSFRPLVWFGLISFPLYLWHWPILTFVRIVAGGDTPNSVRIAAVALTIALAVLTSKYIEKPLRFGRRKKPIYMGLILTSIAVGVIGFVTFEMNGIPQRYPSSINDLSARTVTEGGPHATDCYKSVSSVTSASCVTMANSNVVVLGDSHARVLAYGLFHSSDPEFNRPTLISASSCPPTLNVEARKGCDFVLKQGLDFIARTPSVKYVVLSAFSGFVLDANSEVSKNYFDGYIRTIQEIEKQGKKVILAMDNYTLRSSAQLCAPINIEVRKRFKAPPPEFCSHLTFADDLVPHAEYNKFILRVHAAHPETFLYNPEPVFCPGGQCSLFQDGKLLMDDKDHLSTHGSILYVQDMIRQLQSVLPSEK